MKWLKKNWLNILVVVCVAWIILAYLDSRLAEKQYKADIETLDNDIAQTEKENEVIKEENAVLKVGREKDKAIIAADKVKMRRDEVVIAKIRGEMSVLEERTKKLPLSDVVIETRKALNTKEVEAYQEGVLYSLVAARKGLAIFQGFSLLKEDRDKLQVNYDRAKGALEKAEGILGIDEEIFIGFDDINFNLEGIIEKKDEKFNLSEKRNRAMYWKGIKHGAPSGGLFVLFLWLVFGK